MEHVHKVTEVREEPEHVEHAGGIVMFARIINFIFGVIITFIALRFILLLLGANQGNAFVDFIYSISGIFVAPFYGIFNNTPAFGASVVDISSIVAMIVYALVAWALVALVTIGSRNRTDIE